MVLETDAPARVPPVTCQQDILFTEEGLLFEPLQVNLVCGTCMPEMNQSRASRPFTPNAE